jgi:hypothetical protein
MFGSFFQGIIITLPLPGHSPIFGSHGKEPLNAALLPVIPVPFKKRPFTLLKMAYSLC